MTRGGERGSATVNAAIFVGFLTTVALVGASVAALYVGHRRAATAADLAALAGASALQRDDAGCDAAGIVARANHAELVGCETAGGVLTVRVAFDVPTWFGSSVDVPARARAGPVR